MLNRKFCELGMEMSRKDICRKCCSKLSNQQFEKFWENNLSPRYMNSKGFIESWVYDCRPSNKVPLQCPYFLEHKIVEQKDL